MVGPEGLQVGGAPSGDGRSPGGDCAGGDWAGGYWAWAGAHGGAGTTTLAAAVPGGADFGRSLPEEAASPGLPAVVVCRSNAKGLAAGREAARRAASLGTRVLGLVVVADMPERRRPKPLAEALYLTRGAYEETWEVPWVPAWRFGEAPAPANSPPQVRELLVGIWSALGLPLPGGANQKKTPTKKRQGGK